MLVDPKLQQINVAACLRCGAPFPANGIRTLCHNCMQLIPKSGPFCICDGPKLRGGKLRHTIDCIVASANDGDPPRVTTRADGFEIIEGK